MSSSIYIDEPLIVPVTIGETLETATRVLGVLSRLDASTVEAAQIESLRAAQQGLLAALGGGDADVVGSTLQVAQQQLWQLYESVKQDGAACAALNFPVPEFIADQMVIDVVDVRQVRATFSVTGKQILTSLSFPRAANAKSYWLHEVRYFPANPDERVEDPILETHTPLFDRVRLAPGTRILRIKSRNLSVSAISEEFTVEVPAS